jgi:hypothetical protein
MSSPFAKKFCGKKSGLHYGKGPLHNEPEKKGKTVNEVKDPKMAAKWLENHANGDITLKAIEVKKLKETINS